MRLIHTVMIKSASDIASARLEIRRSILKTVKCDIKALARCSIALTSLGELLIALQPKEPIPIYCNLINSSNNIYLQYVCNLQLQDIEIQRIQRYRINFEAAIDGVVFKTDDSNVTIQGIIQIS